MIKDYNRIYFLGIGGIGMSSLAFYFINANKSVAGYDKVNSLITKFFKEEFAHKNEIKTISRQSVIIPKFIGYTVQIHNGKTFSKLKITEDMVGHKLGEFAPTRKRFNFKKKKIRYWICTQNCIKMGI